MNNLEPMDQNQFIAEYISFNKLLRNAEKVDLNPKDYLEMESNRLDLFRFWFIDRRDMQSVKYAEEHRQIEDNDDLFDKYREEDDY